jgi:uncharacterized protein YaaW (UPF0174 family)
MIFNFLDQHRWWFIVTMSALTWAATAAVLVALAGDGQAPFTGQASIAAAVAVIATAVYFLTSSHAVRVWTIFRLKRQIRRREALLTEIAENLGKTEHDRVRWSEVRPLDLEVKEVLDMATDQERGALQTLTLARGTEVKDLETRIRQLGTPLWEIIMRRFRGVSPYRDYEVVVRNAASAMDVATDKGYAQAELEAALMRRIFSARLALLQPDERDKVLAVWHDFGNEHRDSLTAHVPALSPDMEADLAGAGTYTMATILAGAVVHERGLTLPTSFFHGVSAMLPPLIGALGWRITAGTSARFLQFLRVRRVLPAVVVMARIRSGLRVRRTKHLAKLETERDNLAKTASYVETQLSELREQLSHLGNLKFSMRRLRMVLPLA